MTIEEQVVDSWRIGSRINLYLLDSFSPEMLQTAPAKGRSVAETFAHIHNVRIMWLDAAAKGQFPSVGKLAKEAPLDGAALREALEASAAAIETLITLALEQGKVKGFKPHPVAFVGYLLAHEAHHRGAILLILKEAKLPVDKKIAYGMWEWGVR